jgi:protein O-mannosyl-transferase
VILWWKWGKIPRRHVLAMLPLFAVAVVMGSITGWMERTHVGAVGPEWNFTLLERVLIAGRAAWFYAYKIILPFNLAFIYPRWEIDATAGWQYLFPLGAIAVVAGLWALRGRIGRGPLACALFFGGTLVPALGFVNVYPHRFSFVADHFQYLAGIGLIVLAAELLTRASLQSTRSRRAGWLVCVPVGLGLLTWFQAHMYRDARTLWEVTLQRNPEAWIAHAHLGGIVGAGDLATGVGHYAEAIRLNPDQIEAYIGLGNLLLNAGNPTSAAEQFQRAILARPEKPTPYYGLGAARVAAGDGEAAVRAYERALEADPRFIPARSKLVELYTSLGRSDDAARQRLEVQRQLGDLLGR